LVECLRLGSGMPAPTGQIPPPWAWWKNEAPATRATCSPSQAQHGPTVSQKRWWSHGVRATPPRVPVRVCLEPEGLSRAAIQLGRDGIQRCLVELAQVAALGEVLAEQAVGVLVGAALPGAAWVAEVDLDARVDVNWWCSAMSRPWSQVSERRSCWGKHRTAAVSAGRMRWAVNPLGSPNSTR
jgi:hypothetical protein